MIMREMRRDNDVWNRILIIYDIERDKTRTKVVRVLESYGIRVQKSAFECHLNSKRIIALTNQLKKIVKEDDSIRIYQVKDRCFDVGKNVDVKIYSSNTVIV